MFMYTLGWLNFHFCTWWTREGAKCCQHNINQNILLIMC